MLLYLVRHGESYVNLTRTFSYRRIDDGLTPRGLEQARALARWFTTRAPIARIYSSPLKRGLETAREVALATGAQIEVVEALREINVGSLEGRADAEAWQLHDDILRRWSRGETHVNFPDGEDFLTLHARVTGFLERLPADGDVVAVGHGGIFCNVLPHVCSVPWDAATPFTLDNTGVSIFHRADAFTCEQWNGQAHLL